MRFNFKRARLRRTSISWMSRYFILRHFKKQTLRKLFLGTCLSIIFITIFLNVLIKTEMKEDINDIIDLRNDTEIRMILKDTPYLWRKSVYNKTESISQRIEDQRLWIQRISRTNYIRNGSVKRILVQDPLEFYWGTEGRLQCPYAPEFENKCLIEKDKLEKASLPFTYLWTRRYLNKDVVTGMRDWGDVEITLPPGVKQILYFRETPHTYTVAHLGWNDALLASYMKASDVPIPYHRWIPTEDSQPINVDELDVLFARRSKKAVAVISNCKLTINHRLEFIKELQKHIEVDVFGKCGELTCPERPYEARGRDPGVACLSMLEKHYKFYLAFENTNCVDYITEKFFVSGLNYSMLPVVMGAHPDSYLVDAPPHSYIHVDDFESPEALAAYLNYLDRNDSAYKEYFKWKGTGYVSEHEETIQDFFCRLCGMLFYADFVPSPSWNNSELTWKDVNYCLPEGQWYWK